MVYFGLFQNLGVSRIERIRWESEDPHQSSNGPPMIPAFGDTVLSREGCRGSIRFRDYPTPNESGAIAGSRSVLGGLIALPL